MRTRASSSGFAMVTAGATVVAFWLAIVAINVTLGAWALQYVVSYWTLYFAHVAKHVPFLPAAVAGLFLGEFTIPAAIGTWIVSFIL